MPDSQSYMVGESLVTILGTSSPQNGANTKEGVRQCQGEARH